MAERFKGFERREQGGRAVAIGLVAAAWAILAFPWLSGSVSIPWDSKAHFLPQLQFLAQSMGGGESPFWAPYVFSGHPQIADPQSLMFSPPMLLLALVDPSPTAWAADAMQYLLLLVSMAAMVVWLRDKGWHPAAIVLTALAFGFGAAMAWRAQHLGQVMSLAYLPPLLLCLDRALARRSALWGAAAGLFAASLILGRDQVALLAIYFLVAYVPWRMFDSGGRVQALKSAILPLGTAAFVTAALIAIPIALTLLTAAQSNRPSIDFIGAGRGSLHPALFFTTFSADVFGASGKGGEYWGPPSGRWSGLDLFLAQNMGVMYAGALSIALIVTGAVSGLLWRREARLFTIALVLTALYALGWYTPVFKLMHSYLPGVDLYRRPADAAFNIGFLMAVLAGFTLHTLMTEGIPRFALWQKALLAALPVAAFAAMLGLAHHFGMLAQAASTIGLSAVLYAAAMALLMFAPRARSALLVTASVSAFMTIDLAISNGPNGSTALPPETFEVLDSETSNDTIAKLKDLTARGQSPTRRDRVELVGFGFHWPNASLTHRLENTLGYNPVRNARYVAATGAGDHAGLAEQKNFSPLFPSYRSRLADLLGLRYIATSVPVETIDKVLKPGDLDLVARTREGYIYENKNAVPRVLFAPSAQRADFFEILKSGTWPAFDPATTVLLEADAPKLARGAGRAEIEAYHLTSVTLAVTSPDGGYAVLNDLWHPWWVARIDGAEVPILQANVLFRAVAVPPGSHRVVMTFEPLRGAWKELSARISGSVTKDVN